MSYLVIKSAAVIGAGVMGSGIAAHLANSGIPTLLLDIVPKNSKDRNLIAKTAIEKQLKSKLSGFYHKKFVNFIREGNLEDDFERLSKVDWIIEAVPENVDIKQELFARLEDVIRDVKVVSSNTSGIPLKVLTKDRSEQFCQKFLVTHFFNPPRFMHLVEMVSGADTDANSYRGLKKFIESKMGKGVIECFDTPNFIANRVGCFDILAAIKAMQKHQLTIEEVDAIVGPVTGRPKTGVFRLLDMIGIDTIGHVIANMHSMLSQDIFRDEFLVPEFIQKMNEKGYLGAKNGKGFYAKSGEEIKVLDLTSMDYVDKKGVNLLELKELKQLNCQLKAVKALCGGDSKTAKFAKDYLGLSILYASYCLPEIAKSVVDIDLAMQWGYNHEIGPFKMWDALGVKEIAEYLKSEGYKLSPVVVDVLEKGEGKFYRSVDGCTQAWNFKSQKYEVIPSRFGHVNLHLRKEKNLLPGGNEAISLVELPNDLLFIEMHGKKNTFSMKVVECITKAIENNQEKFRGAIIGTQGDTFSAGADLTEMISAAQSGKLEVFEKAITNFQRMSMTIRHSSFPIVSALNGYVFGGGCEVAMHSAARQSVPETYMGLVEAGVGLLPAGGGCKEMARLAAKNAGPDGDLFEYINLYFQTVAMAKVSGSAHEIAELGFSNSGDGISCSKETLLHDAISRVELLASQGYTPPNAGELIRVGGLPVLTELRARINILGKSGMISLHDAIIADRIAYIICGGEIDGDSLVTADYLLMLEKIGFFQLLQTPKTQERIAYMLKNGKPLRN